MGHAVKGGVATRGSDVALRFSGHVFMIYRGPEF